MADRQRSLVREHLGLVISGAISVVACLKVLSLGRYDPTTALAVLQVAGTSKVLLGTVVLMLPSVATLTVFIAYIRYGHRFRSLSSVERSAILAATGPLGVLILAMAPMASIVGIAIAMALVLVVAGIARLIRWMRKAGESETHANDTPSTVEQTAAALILPIWLLLSAVQAPWLPTEAVAVNGGPATSAYVIGERNEDTVFLPTEAGRGLQFEPTEEVTRCLCSDDSWMSKNLVSLVSGNPYPKCPDNVEGSEPAREAPRS